MLRDKQKKENSPITKTIVLVLILVFVMLIVGLGTYVFQVIKLQRDVPFLDPPESLNEADLIGVWQAKYMEWGVDTIIIQEDRTFDQLYIDKYFNDGNFKFESSQNIWWIEVLGDGRVHLHLQNGRYFLNGVMFAEQIDKGIVACPSGSSCEEDISLPIYLYDWIGNESIKLSNG